jgi:hypothetical protein
MDNIDISMEQWVRDGRHLIEGGKGVCDCIVQFSDEDSSPGLVETSRSLTENFVPLLN